jgi:hypothetical protein
MFLSPVKHIRLGLASKDCGFLKSKEAKNEKIDRGGSGGAVSFAARLSDKASGFRTLRKANTGSRTECSDYSGEYLCHQL